MKNKSVTGQEKETSASLLLTFCKQKRILWKSQGASREIQSLSFRPQSTRFFIFYFLKKKEMRRKSLKVHICEALENCGNYKSLATYIFFGKTFFEKKKRKKVSFGHHSSWSELCWAFSAMAMAMAASSTFLGHVPLTLVSCCIHLCFFLSIFPFLFFCLFIIN